MLQSTILNICFVNGSLYWSNQTRLYIMLFLSNEHRQFFKTKLSQQFWQRICSSHKLLQGFEYILNFKQSTLPYNELDRFYVFLLYMSKVKYVNIICSCRYWSCCVSGDCVCGGASGGGEGRWRRCLRCRGMGRRRGTVSAAPSHSSHHH